MSKPIETAPVMDLSPRDLEHLVEELRAYHALYSPVFRRREQREWAGKYRHGLRLEIPRTSIAPMVLALDGANPKAVRARQLCITAGAWAAEALRYRHWQAVDRALGEDDGVLTLDGSDFLTQGQPSVGVKRQSGGEVGKRANGQAGVYVGDARRRGYTRLDRRRYWPQAWVADEA